MKPRQTSTGTQSPEQLKLDSSWLGAPSTTPISRRPPKLSGVERQFYHACLTVMFLESDGREFEKKISSILHEAYEDFINPEPWGREGDWGCDGYIDGGRHVFACYGAEQKAYENDYLRTKVSNDLDRAIEKWPMMKEWTFITNAKCGVKFTTRWESLRAEHGPGSDRPIAMHLWQLQDLFKVILSLTEESLDLLFPGAESSRDFELADFIDMIEEFAADASEVPDSRDIDAVSPLKMDYNKIDNIYRDSLMKGMECSALVQRYFDTLQDPSHRDLIAGRFRANYLELRKSEDEPGAIIEELCDRVGGSQFRTRGRVRYMSTLAAVSYFFQTCDIFENAPEGWSSEGGDATP